jgi:hypothetical protein
MTRWQQLARCREARRAVHLTCRITMCRVHRCGVLPPQAGLRGARRRRWSSQWHREPARQEQMGTGVLALGPACCAVDAPRGNAWRRQQCFGQTRPSWPGASHAPHCPDLPMLITRVAQEQSTARHAPTRPHLLGVAARIARCGERSGRPARAAPARQCDERELRPCMYDTYAAGRPAGNAGAGRWPRPAAQRGQRPGSLGHRPAGSDPVIVGLPGPGRRCRYPPQQQCSHDTATGVGPSGLLLFPSGKAVLTAACCCTPHSTQLRLLRRPCKLGRDQITRSAGLNACDASLLQEGRSPLRTDSDSTALAALRQSDS